jgi:HSP20 family protein
MLRTMQEFDRSFPAFNELRRRMDAVWAGYEEDPGFSGSGHAPAVSLRDDGEMLVVRAEVPGLGEKDVTVTLNQDVLTLAGERKVQHMEGYRPHRQERAGYRFSRSFSLPTRVDGDKVTATVSHGVLTVQLPKARESQPRQINVRGA